MSVDLAVATPAFLDLTFVGLEQIPAPGEERFAGDLLRSPGGGAITAPSLNASAPRAPSVTTTTSAQADSRCAASRGDAQPVRTSASFSLTNRARAPHSAVGPSVTASL